VRLIIYIFFTSFLFPILSDGQIVVFKNSNEFDYKTSNIKYIVQDGIHISDAALNEVLNQKWNPYLKHNVKLENKEQTIWIKIPIKSSDKSKIDLLEIKEPLINFVQVWIVKDGLVLKRFEKTGDHMPFYSRPIDYANFVFPFSEIKNNEFDVIIATDKRHTTKSIPLYFYTENEFSNQVQLINLLKGFLLGLVSILFLYNFYLAIIARKMVYIWYGIYLFFILIYFLMDMGLLFQFFYPNAPKYNDVLRVAVISFSIVPFTFFLNQFLQYAKHKPSFVLINYVLLFLFTVTFTLGIIGSISGDFENQQFWIRVYGVISPFIIFVLLAESIYAWLKKIPFSNFTTISIGGFVIMSTIFLLHEKRIIGDNIFTNNIINIGISIEILLMTLAIAYRFNLYKKESEILLLERNEIQRQMLTDVIKNKEQEMQRLSSILHDSVGARISAIRLNLEQIIGLKNQNVKDIEMKSLTLEVSKVADEIRDFSHQISPLLLEKNGIIKSIYDLVKSVNNANIIQLQFESLGSENTLFFQYELMVYNIVQELIQNMIKHSNATEGIIQIILEKDFISLFVEDNGKGFLIHETKDGLGFLQIKKMVNFAKGSINIQSEPNKGCTISIEIKIQNNEEVN
jgi:signal transduction histidine kinase